MRIAEQARQESATDVVAWPGCGRTARATKHTGHLELAAALTTAIIWLTIVCLGDPCLGISTDGAPVMNFAKHIVRDKGICGGQPVIAGTQIPLRTVLASLAEGDRAEDILADLPTLTEESVRAVIAFAATAAEEDQPVPAVPALA